MMAGGGGSQPTGVQDDQHPTAWQHHGQGTMNVSGRTAVSKAALTAALQKAAGVGGVGRNDNTKGLRLGMGGSAPREVPAPSIIKRDTGYSARLDNTTSPAHTGELGGGR